MEVARQTWVWTTGKGRAQGMERHGWVCDSSQGLWSRSELQGGTLGKGNVVLALMSSVKNHTEGPKHHGAGSLLSFSFTFLDLKSPKVTWDKMQEPADITSDSSLKWKERKKKQTCRANVCQRSTQQRYTPGAPEEFQVEPKELCLLLRGSQPKSTQITRKKKILFTKAE